MFRCADYKLMLPTEIFLEGVFILIIVVELHAMISFYRSDSERYLKTCHFFHIQLCQSSLLINNSTRLAKSNT